MKFLFFLVPVGAVFVWRKVARFYIRRGHKTWVSHFAGLACGSFSFLVAMMLLIGVVFHEETNQEQAPPPTSPPRASSQRPTPLKPPVESQPRPKSADYSNAEDVLTFAYLNHVPQATKAPFVRCKHKSIESRHFVLCHYDNGFAGGSNGLWEVTFENGEFSYFAINGSALSALDHLPFSDAHKHPNPSSIDIPATLNVFAGKGSN